MQSIWGSIVIVALSAGAAFSQAGDPQQMIVPMVQSFGYPCGKALYTVPHNSTNQTFDLVCSENANGSGAEHTYVIDLSTGTLTVTPK